MPEELELRVYRGAWVEDCLNALARLRMTVFREWPYLYDGNAEYERRYLDVYVRSPRSFALVAYDNDEPVGATTALPLADEHEELQQPLLDAGFDIERVFYNGESMLLPEYRGRGLYRKFFKAREDHAASFGTYDWIVFCSVSRPEHHPLRPAEHLPLDPTWRRYGYEQRPDLIAHLSWQDIGDVKETGKRLEYWIKRLE